MNAYRCTPELFVSCFARYIRKLIRSCALCSKKRRRTLFANSIFASVARNGTTECVRVGLVSAKTNLGISFIWSRVQIAIASSIHATSRCYLFSFIFKSVRLRRISNMVMAAVDRYYLLPGFMYFYYVETEMSNFKSIEVKFYGSYEHQ